MAAKLFSQKEITLADALEHGLTEAEYQQICAYLGGRSPTDTELGIYSGLWSEHCSYKNSILQLKTLPTKSRRTLTSAGEENAGALDIGDGLAVVFKIESHNHPTAVEPYQGAATGVGGIMRDIFTMGARPLCSLNSLRFGPPAESHNRFLLDGAVKGIGDYGNCLGIPVLGGELFFDESFSRNPLVNAMTVGIVSHKEMASATAGTKANMPVFIVGATTGRDGIHGASFASQDLSAESESKRSAVQVGDPFMEKLLMEASLELIASGHLIGIQDMGAAGLSCSSSEMSARGGMGMDLNLDKVPLRESGMNAYEIMLSESQERMLVVVERGDEERLQAVFARWELFAVEIGTVRSDGLLVVHRNGEQCSAIPADSLVLGGGAPRYVRDQKRPAILDAIAAVDTNAEQYITAGEPAPELLQMLARPNICSRRPVYEQYDSEVGLARVAGPGADSGVARVPGTNKGIAVSTDCNSRYVYMNPFEGTRQAVHEAARNVAMSGSQPIGITNCLNFGNPYVPENYYVFAQAIAGMKKACEDLGTPVTGGNVSFYNESDQGPVMPTPTIGMVGLIENVHQVLRSFCDQPDQEIWLVGKFAPNFGGSEYQAMHGKAPEGSLPLLEADTEIRLIQFMRLIASRQIACAARDLSLGGLAVALFKLVYNPERKRSAALQLDAAAVTGLASGPDQHRLWFGETNGSALVCVAGDQADKLADAALETGVPIVRLGRTLDGTILDYGIFQVESSAAIDSFENGIKSVFHSVYAEDA
ncbi:MAG: phosphoribosylformylglycinamidine synthase subunit PurL [Leptospiraceae bacterium]|nr:phosphoribosylformylglycinamidine synthase subunit PurL [Leptospiraceae bacterium]